MRDEENRRSDGVRPVNSFQLDDVEFGIDEEKSTWQLTSSGILDVSLWADARTMDSTRRGTRWEAEILPPLLYLRSIPTVEADGMAVADITDELADGHEIGLVAREHWAVRGVLALGKGGHLAIQGTARTGDREASLVVDWPPR